jgi:hypothetical protein
VENCISASNIETLGRATLHEFDIRIAEMPKDLCAPFYQEAGQLEAQFLMLYQMTVLCNKGNEDLDEIASVWGVMVSLSDECSKSLSRLSQAHPNCGASIYHDRMLDMRNKCQRLQKMHA